MEGAGTLKPERQIDDRRTDEGGKVGNEKKWHRLYSTLEVAFRVEIYIAGRTGAAWRMHQGLAARHRISANLSKR